MMKPTLTVAMAVLFLSIPASFASAGPVERACLKSDRAGGNRGLCACIQQAADITLRGSDQRKAAQLMNDPDRAHSVWISKRADDDAFWERYKNFGQTAEAYCRG